jgi:glyoxylase-like metal-dependent hydrolase (beta-lactamase superfamily II)
MTVWGYFENGPPGSGCAAGPACDNAGSKEVRPMMRWRIGEVTVTKVVELEVTGGTRFLLPQATYDAIRPIAWLRPHFADPDGRLRMSIHALVVETPARRIVVDTCIGNDKQGRRMPGWNNLQTRFLEDLAEAGHPRQSIDTVLCTHLHVDHVGWNTMLVDGRWVPSFPKARYLMGRVEFAHWQARQDEEDYAPIFADSVKPVADAGLVDLVETDHRLCEEVSLVPTPGHTPGHVSVRIASRGEEALITGDFLHHPCQMARPDWSSEVDHDKEAAHETRRRVFAELAGTPTLVIGTHFAGATAGRVVRDGDAFRLDVG